jgi:hypothetical protein
VDKEQRHDGGYAEHRPSNVAIISAAGIKQLSVV